MAIFHHIIQPFSPITHSSNTHTVDLDKSGNNYSITATNAQNTINFSNLDATRIGKAGNILITNPASVGSLSFASMQNTVYVPGGASIAFNTSANAVSIMSYLVIASNKILINYVSDYSVYGSNTP